MNAVSGDSETESVSQFFHILGSVEQQRGCCEVRDGQYEITLYTSCCNAARGMSLVALHNGGGTDISKAINGGFGLVLDGSARVDEIIRSALSWDVMGGVARRAWARNPHAMEVSLEHNRNSDGRDHITLPYLPKEGFVEDLVNRAFRG